MLIPAFRTWVTGEVVTAAELNSNIRDAGNFLLSWPVAELRQTVAQSLTNNTNSPVLLDAEDIDTDNGHSTVTNTSRYTPVTLGRFQLSGAVSYAANGTSYRNAELWKNGVVLNSGSVSIPALTGAPTRVPTRTITTVANGSTDYFELYAVQGSGGALNTAVNPIDYSSFSIRMVGTT